MSISRLFSMFVALALVVGVVLTVQAGIATSNGVSSPKAVLDQHERHASAFNPGYASGALDQHDRHPNPVNADEEVSQLQALPRTAVLEQGSRYDRAPMAAQPAASSRTMVLELGSRFDRAQPATYPAGAAPLEFRRGEWNAGRAAGGVEFDMEQARIGWRARK